MAVYEGNGDRHSIMHINVYINNAYWKFLINLNYAAGVPDITFTYLYLTLSSTSSSGSHVINLTNSSITSGVTRLQEEECQTHLNSHLSISVFFGIIDLSQKGYYYQK